MAEQIAAHDRVEKLRSLLAAAEADGDVREARRLRVAYAQARRRWHRLVREVEALQRARR